VAAKLATGFGVYRPARGSFDLHVVDVRYIRAGRLQASIELPAESAKLGLLLQAV
jgi:hypothetical protein